MVSVLRRNRRGYGVLVCLASWGAYPTPSNMKCSPSTISLVEGNFLGSVFKIAWIPLGHWTYGGLEGQETDPILLNGLLFTTSPKAQTSLEVFTVPSPLKSHTNFKQNHDPGFSLAVSTKRWAIVATSTRQGYDWLNRLNYQTGDVWVHQ